MRSAVDRLRMFSLRELTQNRVRVTASTVVVAVCTALLVTVLSIIASIDRSIDDAAAGVGGDARLEVTASSNAGLPSSLTAQLDARPEVAHAVPSVQTSVLTDRAGTLLMVGVDATATTLNSPLQSEFGAQAARILQTPDGVLAGPRTGLAVGDRLSVNGTTVTVVAVPRTASADRFNSGRYLAAPLRLAQQVTPRGDAVDSILLIPAPGTHIDAMRSAAERVVAGRGLLDIPSAQRTRASNGVELIRYVALSSAALTFVVAAFLIYVATSMALASRRPRISMLRALGGTRRMIVGDLLIDTAVVSLIGAVVGVGLGTLLARITIGRLPALFLQSLGTRIEFSFPVWVAPAAVLTATGTCVLAAALAARQVYEVSPVEALAPVRTARPGRGLSRARVAAAIVVPVLGVAAFYNATRQPGILANSGITVMFAAEIAFGFALSGPLIAAAARLATVAGGVGVLAGETMRRTPTRSWATLMTVAVAVAATLAISAGNSNAVDSTKESFAALRGADVWVSTTPAGEFPTGPSLPSSVESGVRSVPGVAGVVGEQARYVSVGDQRALTYGVTAGAANPLLTAADNDARTAVLGGRGVVMSRDLAESLSVSVGDEVPVTTGTGQQQLRVVSIVPFFSALNGAMAMSRTRMAQMFGETGVSTLAVHAGDGAAADRVLQQIRGILPPGTYAYTGTAAVEAFGEALDQATTLNHLIWIIVTIIAGVALLNTLLLSVLERRRELAVLRAIGAGRRFVVGMVAAEAGAVGLVGGVLGLGFGMIQQVVADLASSRAWSVDVQFVVVPVSLALAAGALLLCVSGALPPAARVSQLNIIKAMRIE